jgi:glycosyltransferase involved in cell wall biosynthesis
VSLVEITGVELADRADPLQGHYIDIPKQGSLIEASAVDIVGWALGLKKPVVAVELLSNGRMFRRISTADPRPDLVAAFPGVPHAGKAGFRTFIDVLSGRTPTVEVELRAVLKDRTRASLGVIRMRRRWPEEVTDPTGPLVSVIIPCFNQGHLLGEAIESALRQSHPKVEVVVVDDGSTDNTLEVAAGFPGVSLAIQDNQGLAAARNTGIRRSNGDFLVFLDADDRLLPDGVQAGLRCLQQHPEAAFAAGRCRIIGFDGSLIPTVHPTVDDDPYAALLRNAPIWAGDSVIFRRSVFRVVGQFDTSMNAAEDYDLFYRIGKDHPFAFHDHVVVEYRRHGGNMTRDPVLMLRSNLGALRAQKQHVKGDERLKRAYRQGIRYWATYYGTLLVEEIRSLYQERRIRSLGRVLRLLRYYPRGIRELVGGDRSRGGERTPR